MQALPVGAEPDGGARARGSCARVTRGQRARECEELAEQRATVRVVGADGRERVLGRADSANAARVLQRDQPVGGVGGCERRVDYRGRQPAASALPPLARRVLASELEEATRPALARTLGGLDLESLTPWRERDGFHALMGPGGTQGSTRDPRDPVHAEVQAGLSHLACDRTWANMCCPRCSGVFGAHRLVYWHINQFRVGQGAAPHVDAEEPCTHPTVVVAVLPQSGWAGGGAFRVAAREDGGVRLRRARHSTAGQEPKNWHADSVDCCLYEAWDAVWVVGEHALHGVSRVSSGVRYSLCVCFDCPGM